jgi:CRISPR-associated protein Csm3
MFRKSLNRAVLRIRVETVTPLLIRAGDAGMDPAAADLTPVRTHHGQHGPTVYIPGSSLKGVLRAAAEAQVRGQRFGDVDGACANPLDHRGHSCSNAARTLGKQASTSDIHRIHCLACRLFGSLAMKGRVSVHDLLPWAPDARDGDHAPDGTNHARANRLELRHGVAIDRITGAAQRKALFEQELVPAGVFFWGEIALENYQAWQLGLLAQAFDEMNHGVAQLGSSKSRGLGAARITVESIVHEQTAPGGKEPLGVGMLVEVDERVAYGLLSEQPLPPHPGEVRGLAMRFEVPAAPAQAWLDAGLRTLGGLT